MKEATDKWNRIESQEIDRHSHTEMIFDKGPKAMQTMLEQLIIHMQKTEQILHPSKINSQWIIDLNVNCKAIASRKQHRKKPR